MNHSLPESILRMQGMSGVKYRILLNNLLRKIPDSRYLEIGSWTGSTACSAMWGNTATVTCIDNWSQFGGPKEIFLNNAKLTKGNCNFNFIEADFRSVDYSKVGKYNIYMFDGPHSESDQFDGIIATQQALDSEFLLIVDDYNWPEVRDGTSRAMMALDLQVVYSINIRTTQNNTQPMQEIMEKSEWHNGYFLAVARKTHKDSSL